MKSPLIRIRIPVPEYESCLLFYTGPMAKFKEVAARHNIHIPKKKTVAGLTWCNLKTYPYVSLSITYMETFDPASSNDIRTLAHECTHAAVRLLRYLEVKYSKDEETLCLLQSYYMYTIHKQVTAYYINNA